MRFRRFHAVYEARRKGQKCFNAPTLDRFEDAYKKILRQGPTILVT